MKNKTTCFLLSIFCTINFALAQPAIKWQKTFGGSGYEYANSISRTSDLGYIVAGISNSLDGDITGNHGNMDYWIVKLDSAGTLQWQKSLGGSNYDEALSIQQTADGGYIAAGYAFSTNGDVINHYGPGRDYWVVKLDNAGNIQWQKCLGGNGDDAASSIQQTSDLGYIVAGITRSNDGDVAVHYGSLAYYDYWIVKLNSSGIIQWQKTLGGSLDDYASSIRQTNDMGYIISGYSHSNDSDVTNHRGPSLHPDYWIVKVDSIGTIQWQKSLGGTSNDYGTFAQQTYDGGYIVAGDVASNDSDVTANHSFGSGDYWIVKLDSAGTLQWEKCLGGMDEEKCKFIQQTTDSGYVVIGHGWSYDGDMSGNHSTARDIWIVKLDGSGNMIWQRALGGTNEDFGYSVCQTANGNYVIAGSSNSSNGDLNLNRGNYDWWIANVTEKYNSITGRLFYDANLNGMYDTLETLLTNHRVTESASGEFSFSKPNGNYNVNVFSPGNFSVAPSPLSYHNIVPANHPAIFSGYRQLDSLNDFAFQPTGAFNDLCVTITPVSRFRPYRTAYYTIDYYNAGTTTLSPSIVFLPDNYLTYFSASVTPATITSDSVIWNLPPLLPAKQGSIFLTVGVLGTAPVGISIVSNVRIDPVANDANPACNYSSCSIGTTSSFDPNEMLVDRDTILTTEISNPPYLEYIIYFQNTGNDTAFDIKVNAPVDTALLQLSTLEFVTSSHPADMNYRAWTADLEFTLANILLPDSNVDEPGSHGFVRYRIKPKSTLVAGDSIVAHANIFFDFNAPVLTNSVVTEIVVYASVNEVAPGNSLRIFPNPFNRQAVITFDNPKKELHSFSLHDVTGRQVEKFNTTFGKILLEKGNKTNGVYFVQLTNIKTGSKIFGKLIISGQ